MDKKLFKKVVWECAVATATFLDFTVLPIALVVMKYSSPDAPWPIDFVSICAFPLAVMSLLAAWLFVYIVNDPRTNEEVRAGQLQDLSERAWKWTLYANPIGLACVFGRYLQRRISSSPPSIWWILAAILVPSPEDDD